MKPSFFDMSSIANKVGTQIYREAKKHAYETGKLDSVEKIAEAMANRFHSDVLAAIDHEMKFTAAKEVN